MSTKTKAIIGGLAILILLLLLTAPELISPRLRDEVTAGFTAEFLTRPDGYPGLVEAYDLQFPRSPRQMDPGLMYRACADGAVDVIGGFATDGRIEAYDLFTLEDDRNFFPPYDAAPLARSEMLEEFPEVRDLLNSLAGTIDDEKMRSLNLKVDRDENPLSAQAVARGFLEENNLIDVEAGKGDGSAGRIRVGGKDFSEQNILGEIVAKVIEYNTDINVDRRLYLGGTMICFNALRAGDLDVYVEYTGTGLVSILEIDEEEMTTDPDEVYEHVAREFEEQFDLVWLEPLGFNNTYTLTMRREMARELGVETISDLAEILR